MSFTLLPELPLLHDDDAYLIELEGAEKVVRIRRILVFPGNVNSQPKVESFGDLDSRARKAVIGQINLRHPGKMVHA